MELNTEKVSFVDEKDALRIVNIRLDKIGLKLNKEDEKMFLQDVKQYINYAGNEDNAETMRIAASIELGLSPHKKGEIPGGLLVYKKSSARDTVEHSYNLQSK